MISSSRSRKIASFWLSRAKNPPPSGLYYYQPPHVQNPDDEVGEMPYFNFTAPPYVYFRARNNGYSPTVQQIAWPVPSAGGYNAVWCIPYLKDYVTADPACVAVVQPGHVPDHLLRAGRFVRPKRRCFVEPSLGSPTAAYASRPRSQGRRPGRPAAR